MGNKTLWAMMIVIVMVALACGGPAATTRPTTGAATPPAGTARPATGAPVTGAPATGAAQSEPPEESEPPTASEPPGEPAVPSTPTGYTDLDAALGADQPLKGKRVTIQTQWILGEGLNFDAAVADFEAATGIEIVQESIASQHELVLRTRLEGLTPPDLAVLAQPSAVVEYGDRGLTSDVSTFMDSATLNEQFAAGFGTSLLTGEGGEIWGIPYKVDVKSTIWYPIKAFESHGYAVPTTWEEMEALAAKIVADGNGSPWCLGIKDGQATGWIATDWLEDVMLRTAGIEAYNRWITNDLKFDSPEVRAALAVIAEQWFTDGYVNNGYQSITATDRLEPMDPMFPTDGNWEGFTPGCWMHRQATWFGPDFFPDKRANPTADSQFVVGDDIGIMYFPQIDPAHGTPALGAGDTLMVPTPPAGAEVRPEVKAVAEFLSTPHGLQRWIERGSAISANQTTDSAWYEGFYKLDVAAEIVGNSTSFGFDASDLMPPEANRAFWDGISAWIDAGGTDAATDTFVQSVDAAWPAN
jgi:alpha-glucoside transport system substrate-binding protein